MSEKNPVVLITGGGGYIGSHIVDHLLKKGYRVKATSRPGKTSIYTTVWPAAVKSGQLIPVEIADIATSDFTQAFESVSALIHVAAKVPGKGVVTAEIIADAALRGTDNVIEYALKAGVKKIVYTSTYVALFDTTTFKEAFGTDLVDEDAWGSITKKEQLDLNGNTMSVYAAAKAIAENHFWTLADANPDVDFTALLPPSVYGNFVPNYPLPEERSGLGVGEYVLNLITGGSGGPNTYPDFFLGHAVHVSDIARAHVLAITAPRLSNGRRKRCIVCAPEPLLWPAAAEYLRETRPELRDRLPSAEAVSPKQTDAPMSNKVTEEVLGIKSEDYVGWKVMVDEGIDTALRFEKNLAKA